MLNLLPASLKTGLVALILGAVLVLAGALVLMDYRAKAAEAKAQAAEIALTSYQAALTSAQEVIEAQKAEQALEARLVAHLEGLRRGNESLSKAFKLQRDELVKGNEEARLFYRARPGDPLRRVLDDEDCRASPSTCGHSLPSGAADPLRKSEPDPKRGRGSGSQ